jgi:hypothetical protein
VSGTGLRRLSWIILACLLSLTLEAVAASLCPVPQTDLFIATLISRKLNHALAIGDRPKLVVLAGSNGLFSHRCQAIEPILNMPCINASIAVGVGLDYLFARWRPALHAGDVIYMPMEPDQFTRTRARNRVGPETRLLIHQEWGIMRQLSVDRQLAAVMSVDLQSELRNLVSEPPLAVRMQNINEVLDRDFNVWGDRIGHTAALAAGAKGQLDSLVVAEPDAQAIQDAYGTELIAHFVRWAHDHGMDVIGGLSTGFQDVPLSDQTIDAMRQVFEQNGGRFLILPNRSRYPRHDFFDTRYHLYEACQIHHSVLVAQALAQMLHRKITPAADQVTCGQ